MGPRPSTVFLCVALALASRLALAEPTDDDRAAAQALFDEAQALKTKGDMPAACEKFAASQALDPAVGTQLNLADCYEQIGKLASAWVNYREVIENDEAGPRRAEHAKKRAAVLEPKLTKLVVEVDAPAPDLAITRDGQPVPSETWGVARPLDPGRYRFAATAPGRRDWSREMRVEGEGETIELRVPELETLAADEPDRPSGAAVGSGGGQTIAGATLVAVGGAGLVAGAVLAGIAHKRYGESIDRCLPEDQNACDADGVALREQAQGLQIGYISAFVASAAVVGAGVVVLATAPAASESGWRIEPIAGVGVAGASLRARW